MKWYLAGPMSGVPKFNFPAFEAAAVDLRARGFDIITPHELDDPATRDAAWASPDGAPDNVTETWGDFLARDVKLIADKVSGIIFLDGWHRSRGARLEAFVGLLCGHKFWHYHNGDMVALPSHFVASQLIQEYIA